MKQAAPAGSRAGLALALLCLAAPARAGGSCTISGLACPNEHTDTDMDYTHIDSSNNKWIWSGTTSDGRSWYENDDVSNVAKYLYYSTRAGGWLLTATAPDLSAADPWVGGNVQVFFNGQAHGDSPDGVSHDAALYCGHDTGDPVSYTHLTLPTILLV